MTISEKPLYVYLQRPDTHEWVTVGKWAKKADETFGTFVYAPSYLEAAHPWAIDPANLPLIADTTYLAHRYQGLHDVLRDTCPDAWGRALINRREGLRHDAADVVYLEKAGNSDRWGALAVGRSRKPAVATLRVPRLGQLEILVRELQAMAMHKPPIDAAMRKTLTSSPSLGGARPKSTVLDDDGIHWLVKPRLNTDITDVPWVEYFAMQWGAKAGMRFAETVLHSDSDAPTVLRIRRFDRMAGHRNMAISAASLLGTEYPNGDTERWSYPLLAQALRKIGAPPEDLQELFNRMVFNGVVRNDDDHPRNHAAIYDADARCWRLSPAFDVVPNMADDDARPAPLMMQLSLGRRDVSRDSILADAVHFGFRSREMAAVHLDQLLDRIEAAFPEDIAQAMPQGLAGQLRDQTQASMRVLRKQK